MPYTLPNDTLAVDSTTLAYWKNNPAYDYNRELVLPDTSLMDWLKHWFGELLRKIFGSQFADRYGETILVVIFILAVLLILWFLYKKRPGLFMPNRKKPPLPYSVHEDNIHGIDFDAEIQKALSNHDYRNAVRYLYLQTLKYLSEKELIDWQLYKTPTEYIYEIQSATLRPPFRELTNRFLRVRYGNYEAGKPLFDEMLALQHAMRKGGEA